LREIAHIKAVELKSYEVGSYKSVFTSKDLIIAISQSGETADTIEAIELAQSKGMKVASLVNMLGSTLSRMSDYQYLSRSGPEICVVSTKAFTAQLSWGYYLAMLTAGKGIEAQNQIAILATYLETFFNKSLFTKINSIINKFIVKNEHFFVLGKGQNFNIALEAGLKMKEATYKHFEGFSAGELKHGVIALVEKGTPVLAFVSNDDYKSDVLSAIAEVKARGAVVIAIAQENNPLFDDYIEIKDFGLANSIANIIPIHLLSYFLSVKLNLNPDKPRNLAKSVTVK